MLSAGKKLQRDTMPDNGALLLGFVSTSAS